MTNILIVITKGEVGGAQNSVYNLASALKKTGVAVTIGFDGGEFLKNKLDHAEIPYRIFTWLRRSHNPLYWILFALEIRKYIAHSSFSAIHFNSSNTLFGAIAASLCRPKPKTIFTFRGLSIIDPNYTNNFLLKFLYRLCFKLLLTCIDVPVFVSRANKQYCENIGLARNGVVVYNGCSAESFSFIIKEEARQKLAKIDLKNKFVIGSIGRLAYQKNFDFLIRQMVALKKIRSDVVLVIIGDGPEKENYYNLIEDLNIKDSVMLVGEIAEASRYLKAFDLFAMTSRYEGMPNTLLEALAAGLPIIASDVGGNREILDMAGLLYTWDNEKDFLSKMKILLTDTAAINNLAARARERIKEFTIEKTAQGYLSLYQS